MFENTSLTLQKSQPVVLNLRLLPSLTHGQLVLITLQLPSRKSVDMIWSHCIIEARIADNCDIILSVFGSYPHACMSLLLHGMFVVLPLFIVFVSVLNVSYPLLCNYSILILQGINLF